MLTKSPYEVVIQIWDSLIKHYVTSVHGAPAFSAREAALAKALMIAMGNRALAAHGWTWAEVEEEVWRR